MLPPSYVVACEACVPPTVIFPGRKRDPLEEDGDNRFRLRLLEKEVSPVGFQAPPTSRRGSSILEKPVRRHEPGPTCLASSHHTLGSAIRSFPHRNERPPD